MPGIFHKIGSIITYDWQKPAWSEEDKRCWTNAISACKQMSDEDYDSSQGYIDAINWLKSLRPQSTWKPSDEQMDALRQVISGCSYDIEPLVEIEEHLKKLREK